MPDDDTQGSSVDDEYGVPKADDDPREKEGSSRPSRRPDDLGGHEIGVRIA